MSTKNIKSTRWFTANNAENGINLDRCDPYHSKVCVEFLFLNCYLWLFQSYKLNYWYRFSYLNSFNFSPSPYPSPFKGEGTNRYKLNYSQPEADPPKAEKSKVRWLNLYSNNCE